MVAVDTAVVIAEDGWAFFAPDSWWGSPIYNLVGSLTEILLSLALILVVAAVLTHLRTMTQPEVRS